MIATAWTAFERSAARRRTSAVDVVMGLLVTSAVVGELLDSSTRQPAVVVPVAAVATATLVWRRAAPATVAVVVLLSSLLLSVTARGEFPPQLVFLADLLAIYTAASLLSGRRAWAVGAATLALVWVAPTATGDGDPGDFLPPLVWGAPWAAGRLVRRRTLEAAQAATDAALAVQQRDAQLREAAARERDRIARELHDVVAHGVSLMVVQAGAERLRLGTDAAQTRAVLDDIERAGRTALGELRTMLAVLRSPDGSAQPGRAPQPTLADLPELVERVRDAGVPVQLDADLPADVPATLALSAYRIVQEALTNVLKHAPGRPAAVSVRRDADRLLVEVTSPLPAVPVQSDAPGRGLVGMSERAALHGGTVTSGPVPGGPRARQWRVAASLPLTAPLPHDAVPA